MCISWNKFILGRVLHVNVIWKMLKSICFCRSWNKNIAYKFRLCFFAFKKFFICHICVPGNFQSVYLILVKFPSFIPKIKCTRFTCSSCISHTIPCAPPALSSPPTAVGAEIAGPAAAHPRSVCRDNHPVSTQWKHVLQEITRVLLMIKLKPCWNSQLTIQNGQGLHSTWKR